MYLFRYFVDLHNDVNKRNGKTIFSIDNAYTKYKLSTQFEQLLQTKCKPLYQCFIDGNAKQFTYELLDHNKFYFFD
jgi:hypothetical protein